MDLNHRFLKKKDTSSHEFGRINADFSITVILFLLLVLLSVFTIWPYIGLVSQTGAFSIVFVPIAGEIVQTYFRENSLSTSSLVLLFYILGPCITALWVKWQTKSVLSAFIAGLLVLLPVLPWKSGAPERLDLALLSGDGAQIAGISIMPICLYLLQTYLRTEKQNYFISSMISIIVLSILSFFAVILFFICATFIAVSEVLVSQGKIKIKRFLKITGSSILIIGGIYNISLVRIIFSDSGVDVLHVLYNLVPMSFFLVPTFGILSFLIFDRRPGLQPVFIAVSGMLIFGVLHFIGLSVANLAVFDHRRFAGILSLYQSFLLSLIALQIFDSLEKHDFWKRWLGDVRPQRKFITYGIIGVFICILLTAILMIPHSLEI